MDRPCAMEVCTCSPSHYFTAHPRTLLLPTLELRHCAPSHSFTHPFAKNSVLGPIHRQPASLLSFSHAQHPAGPARLPARVIVCPQPPTPAKEAPREWKHRRRRAQPCAGTQPSFRQPFLESTRNIFRLQGPNPACGSGTIFKKNQVPIPIERGQAARAHCLVQHGAHGGQEEEPRLRAKKASTTPTT